MSYLAHLCRACGHRATLHEPRERAYTGCACCRSGDLDADPTPVILASFTLDGRAEPLIAPGTTRNPASVHTTSTCDCATCHEAYAANSVEPQRNRAARLTA